MNHTYLLGSAVVLVVSLAVIVAARKYRDATKTHKEIITMLDDLNCLLSIEELHVRNNEETHGKGMKNKIRLYVHTEHGLELSGKYTRSKIAKMREKEISRRKKWLDPVGKINLFKLLKVIS